MSIYPFMPVILTISSLSPLVDHTATHAIVVAPLITTTCMYMYIHVVVLITCTTIHICDELKGYFENAQCLPLNTQ